MGSVTRIDGKKPPKKKKPHQRAWMKVGSARSVGTHKKQSKLRQELDKRYLNFMRILACAVKRYAPDADGFNLPVRHLETTDPDDLVIQMIGEGQPDARCIVRLKSMAELLEVGPEPEAPEIA